MKQIYFYLCLLLSVLIISCNEEKVPQFNDERGINFLAWNAQKQQFEDEYTKLKTTINFFSYYINGMEVADAGLKLGATLEGTLSNTDIPVKLSTLILEDYSLAHITFPDVVIKANEHQCSIDATCKHPGEFEKEYGAIIVFDYKECGLVPGTKERQQYKVTVKDATDWAFMRSADETEWNKNYAGTLGKFGPVKVRFILAALGTKYHYTLGQIGSLYYNTIANPNYGFKREISKLNDALNEYNSTHNSPLTEPDGSLVTFEPVAN